jgi:hypothetical protein
MATISTGRPDTSTVVARILHSRNLLHQSL